MVKKRFFLLGCCMLGVAMLYAQKGEQRDLSRLKKVQTVQKVNKKALLTVLEQGQSLSPAEVQALRPLKTVMTTAGERKALIIPTSTPLNYKRSTLPALSKEVIESNPTLIKRQNLRAVKVLERKD